MMNPREAAAEQVVTVENDELTRDAKNPSYFWGVIVKVDCEYSPPDRTVGYSGGWTINGHDYDTFYFYKEEEDGDVFRGGMDALLAYAGKEIATALTHAADQWINHIERSILDEAAQQASDEYEAAQEALYEAKMEMRIERRRAEREGTPYEDD